MGGVLSFSGLETQAHAKQVQALTLCFSRKIITIIDNLGLTAAQCGKVKGIIAAIERYIQGQCNETIECRNFHRRTRREGETFDDILVSLHELAKTCNFCLEVCCQKNIRDQGLLDGQIVKDLLKEEGLTLAATIFKCEAEETAQCRDHLRISGLGSKHSKSHTTSTNSLHIPLLRRAEDVDLHLTQVAACNDINSFSDL